MILGHVYELASDIKKGERKDDSVLTAQRVG